MGTRHLTMVIKNGETKVAQYGQWDGYLEGQGANILHFLKKTNLDYFKEKLNDVSFYTEKQMEENWEDFAISQKIDPKAPFVDSDIMYEFYKIYPTLNRDMGSDILNFIIDNKGKVMLRDDSSFAKDSLFCEFCYVIDFDKNAFEVYEGFNKDILNESERFAKLQNAKDEYKPVKHFISFSLDNLPSEEDFVNSKLDKDD